MTVVSKVITQAIRDKVMTGEFRPGDHLREQTLAEMFDTSRTPVRVALAANAQDGLLDYEPNKGFLVRSISQGDIRQAFEMRALIEGTICRRAAEKGLPVEAERQARRALEVVDKLTEGEREMSPIGRDKWREHNQLFHSAILSQSDNRFFDKALEDVRKIPSVFPPVIAQYSVGELREFNKQHRLILECVLNRSGTRAEALMREHVLAAYASVSKSFEDAPFAS